RRETHPATPARPRAMDQPNPQILHHQPRQRDLRQRHAFLLGDALQQIDQRDVGGTGVRGEAWGNAAEVLRVELRGRIDLPRKEAGAQRAERNEADSQLFARREHAVALGVAGPERILALRTCERVHRVRTPDRRGARLRESEVPYFPLPDQLLDGARDILDGDVRVDPVLVEDVDGFDTEALERGVGHLPDVLRPRVETVARAVGVDTEAELRRDDDLLAEGGERLTDQLLVRERTVRLRCVEEGHAAVDGRADDR